MEVLASSSHELETVEVQTSTCYPAGEVFIRTGTAGTGWVNVHDARPLGNKWLVYARDHRAATVSLDGRFPPFDSTTLAGLSRQPIVLYRPAGQRWSYAEMSRTDDCVRVISTFGRSATIASFGLFGLDVEKGVILRGRVRGVFMPRANDMRNAVRAFSRFAAESPRLSV
jgi:hypothetical protein